MHQVEAYEIALLVGQKTIECQQFYMAVFKKLFKSQKVFIASLAAQTGVLFPLPPQTHVLPQEKTTLALVSSFFSWYLQK